MDLTLGPDEQQVVASAADFLRKRAPIARLHHASGGKLDAALLAEMSALGWFGMALGESDGGVGLTAVEEMLVFREIGRGLGPAAVLPIALAARTAALAGDRTLAAALIGGKQVAGLALADGPVEAAATSISGTFRTFDASEDGLILFATPKQSVLVRLAGRTELPCLDKSIAMGAAKLDGAAVIAQAPGPAAYDAGVLATAAMLQGLSETALAMSVEYAKLRETFGRPIGAYQAVRHPCADMAVRCEASRAQLYFAAVALRDSRADAGLQLAAAKSVANDAATKNADWNIQIHGGIGITAEFDAHLVMKRAQVLSRWFGDTRETLRAVLEGAAR